MIGLIILSVLYLVWSVYAIRDIFQNANINKKTEIWIVITLSVLIYICITDVIKFFYK